MKDTILIILVKAVGHVIGWVMSVGERRGNE